MPAQLRLGWLDATGAVLGLAPGSVPSDVFEPSGDGVVNTALMDGGVAGPGWVVHGVGLFTLDGVLVLSQDLAAPQSPQEIGRASCRERVEAGGGAGGLESAARARS